MAGAAGLALWMLLDASREPGSLSLRLSIPGWLAVLIVGYVAIRWLRSAWHRFRADPSSAPSTAVSGGVASLPGESAAQRGEPLLVRSGRTTHLVDIKAIRWVAAEGKYSRLWLAEGSLLAEYSISELERRLAGHGFVRIHRSRLVNVSTVRALRLRGSRDAEAVLDDGAVLAVSRRRREVLERVLGLRRIRERATGSE
jgi:hypothetical protein